MATIEVNEHVWNGISHYLRALHEKKAVDDTKMKFDNYIPLAELLKLWEIAPCHPSPLTIPSEPG